MSYFSYGGKKIFYQEMGAGEPLLLLHGNAASGKMFDLILPLYQEGFKLVVMDFLGNGRSDRLDTFTGQLWQEEARQTIALIEHAGYTKVNLVGTSGGAWVALNVALERPDLVGKVVADSFDGRTLHPGFGKELQAERRAAKKDEGARQFYEWCHGADWEQAVDADTQALLRDAAAGEPLFRKSLSALKMPILFMGSREDASVRKDLPEEYRQMAAEVACGKIQIFETGGHPAMITNAPTAAEMICEFIGS